MQEQFDIFVYQCLRHDKKKCHLPEAWILNKMEFSGSGKERDIRVQTAHNEKMVVISGNKRTNTSLDWTGGFI